MANILLVDDDPLVLKTLKSAIETKGHTVVTAANGLEGLRQFAQDKFDLVITDVIMPDMEGIGMILEMRRRAPNAKIVAISGGGPTRNADVYLNMAEKLGATAIMKKPIRPAELFNLLNECLGEKSGSIEPILHKAI